MLETELRKNLQSELTKRCEELNELRKEAIELRSTASQTRKRMIESTRVLSHSLQISLHEVRFGSVFDADSKRIRSLPAQRRDAVRIGLARHARRSESDQKQPERAGYSLRLAAALRGVVAAPPSQHSPSSSHFDWLLGSSTECSSSPSSPPRWSWSSVRDRSKTPFATRSSETSRFPWRQRSDGCCRSRGRSGFCITRSRRSFTGAFVRRTCC